MVRTLKWLILVLVFCIGGYMLAEWKMKQEIASFLENKVPNHIDFSYDKLTINLLKGNISFDNVAVVSLGKQTSSCEIKINTDKLAVNGFNYWKLLFEKSIVLKTLSLTKPHLNFKTCPNADDNVATTKVNPINLLKSIVIEEFIFESGTIEIWDSTEETELVAAKSINLNLKNVVTDPDIITQYVPFTFSEYSIAVQNFKAPLGTYEMLEMERLSIDNTNIDIDNIALFTVLSKAALSKKISRQRDHVTLKIPNIRVDNHAYRILNDSLRVNFKELFLSKPNFEIYRDKSRLENFEKKPLYGDLLQKLPFLVTIDTVFIKNGTIFYEEDIPNDEKAGLLHFNAIDTKIANLSNLKTTKDKLTIEIDAELMNAGKFHLDWAFNVHHPRNAFLISGSLLNFNTAHLNDFLVPNLRTKTTGTIDQLYFTISGDENNATGDIKMKYEDFQFQVLNKDRNAVNKVLSFIGNLIINDGSKADANGYRYGTITAERVKHKSFFNFLWVCLQDGLLHTLTGNGEKSNRKKKPDS